MPKTAHAGMAGWIASFLAAVFLWPAAGRRPEAGGSRDYIALANLVGPGDSLAAQDLHFDARAAQDALAFIASHDAMSLDRLANSPALAHLLRHARAFEYDVPRESPRALALHLMKPDETLPRRVAASRKSLAYFTGPLLDDPHWVLDALSCLPRDFRFKGFLFLTFGYDIGVSYPPDASLNGAHTHFDGRPRELLYYAIHELHHAGFMAYQPPRPLAGIKTCADLLRFVEYSTQLEGMAVYAAWERRRRDGALADDGDYVALEDAGRMRKLEDSYSAECAYLKGRADAAADKGAWAVIERMSSGDRLWYRVGALFASRIDRALGRLVLVDLIRQGPARFLETVRGLAPRSSRKVIATI
jgi:hypothetical protein